MLKLLQEYTDALLSYLTVAIAFLASLPLMKIGGAILLVARLIVDVPPAYKKIKKMLK
jgi:hypothetical protein